MSCIIADKSILVSGGAGFIGSNLCEALLEQGNRITCLDNFSTGKRQNVEGLMDNANFKLLEGDIRNIEDCRRAVEGNEYVLHQAALGSVPRSIKEPLTTNEVNITGFLNMLVASRDAGVKRFVYAASSSTYGDHKALPKVEHIIGRPLSPYAVSKYVNELYAEVFSDLYNMQIIGLRYFNVFGPRQDPNGAYAAVIPKFVKLLIEKKSPVINGDGMHSRDFTYINNVIQANTLALLTNKTDAVKQVYNIAYGQRTSLNELFYIIRNALAQYDEKISTIEPQYGPEREGDILHSLASIEKARNLLGYEPEYSVRNGMIHAIDWYWRML